MKKIWVYIYSLLFILFQVSVASHFNIAGLSYGFALISVISVSVIFDKKTAFINAVLCGIIYDYFATQHYGTYLISFFIAALLSIYFSELMYKGTMLTELVLSFVISLVLEIVIYYVFGYKTSPHELTYVLTRLAIPQAFINVFVSIIEFSIYKSLHTKYYNYNRW